MQCETITNDVKYDLEALLPITLLFRVNFLVNATIKHLRLRCFTFPLSNAASKRGNTVFQLLWINLVHNYNKMRCSTFKAKVKGKKNWFWLGQDIGCGGGTKGGWL